MSIYKERDIYRAVVTRVKRLQAKWIIESHKSSNNELEDRAIELLNALHMPDKPEPEGGCPCLYTTPCMEDCTCTSPGSSMGCHRCCKYGSLEQRQRKAEFLAKLLSQYMNNIK